MSNFFSPSKTLLTARPPMANVTAASDSVKGTYAFVSPLSNGDPTYTIV